MEPETPCTARQPLRAHREGWADKLARPRSCANRSAPAGVGARPALAMGDLNGWVKGQLFDVLGFAEKNTVDFRLGEGAYWHSRLPLAAIHSDSLYKTERGEAQ